MGGTTIDWFLRRTAQEGYGWHTVECSIAVPCMQSVKISSAGEVFLANFCGLGWIVPAASVLILRSLRQTSAGELKPCRGTITFDVIMPKPMIWAFLRIIQYILAGSIGFKFKVSLKVSLKVSAISLRW